MTALAWLIPAALFLGALGLLAFLWALRSGQFEDLVRNQRLFVEQLAYVLDVTVAKLRRGIDIAAEPCNVARDVSFAERNLDT